ncbi:MAG: hypothetical protein P4L98_02470 [Ancalomicrobiaceae bacterium]|nr:hypothetical protein [Ancalomicrobiaceae bacterium]
MQGDLPCAHPNLPAKRRAHDRTCAGRLPRFGRHAPAHANQHKPQYGVQFRRTPGKILTAKRKMIATMWLQGDTELSAADGHAAHYALKSFKPGQAHKPHGKDQLLWFRLPAIAARSAGAFAGLDGTFAAKSVVWHAIGGWATLPA